VASGRGALQRELERLTQAGLVTVNLSGRQKYFQANPNSPIFDEICAIVRKTFGLALVLKQALSSVPGSVYWAFIYGSVAKGSDTAGSDIDLMVVADGLSYSVLFERLAPVEQQLGRKINPTLYTAAEFQTRRLSDNHFLRRVLEQTPIELRGTLHDIPQPNNGTPAEPGKDPADQI
jgi:predicted nucleotidyltransferase